MGVEKFISTSMSRCNHEGNKQLHKNLTKKFQKKHAQGLSFEHNLKMIFPDVYDVNRM